MITASQAAFESKNLKEVLKIESDIENNIHKSIEDGRFYCDTSIHISTSKEVRQRIKSDLEKLGYTIQISDNAISERGCPVDQCSYYDTIRVSWEV